MLPAGLLASRRAILTPPAAPGRICGHGSRGFVDAREHPSGGDELDSHRRLWSWAIALMMSAVPHNPAYATPQPTLTSSFSYVSSPGDPVGGGQGGSYAPPSAAIALYGTQGGIHARIATASDLWSIDIVPAQGTDLQSGITFSEATRYPFNLPTQPGLAVTGRGVGCNQDYGSFTVNQIGADSAGQVNLIDVTFTQSCESLTAPPLTGRLEYQVGLVEPPPPPRLPSSFSFMSQAGDPFGGGAIAIYSLATGAKIDLGGTRAGISVRISPPNGGPANGWAVSVAPPSGGRLERGTYDHASSQPTAGAAKLSVGSSTRCDNVQGSTVYGSFTIARIRANALGHVDLLDLTLAAHCGAPTAPTFSAHLLYQIGSSERPLPPSRPTSYTFRSSADDLVGQGQAARYTPATGSVFIVRGDTSDLVVAVYAPADTWTIHLRPPPSGRLDPGTFMVSGTSTSASLDAGDANGSCDGTFGSFTIRDIRSASDGSIEDLDADFIQHCNYPSTPPLTGTIIYRPPDRTTTRISRAVVTPGGDQVTLTAIVEPAPRLPATRWEIVTFQEGQTYLGFGDLVHGKATMTTSALSVGVHHITAFYAGDGREQRSHSAVVTVTIPPVPIPGSPA